MTTITVKKSSQALTIAASMLCIGGIISFYRVNEQSKSAALNIAVGAGAIAIGSQISASRCENEAKDQFDTILQQHQGKRI